MEVIVIMALLIFLCGFILGVLVGLVVWYVWWLHGGGCPTHRGPTHMAMLHSRRPNTQRSQRQVCQILEAHQAGLAPWKPISRTVPGWKRCQATQTFQPCQSHQSCYLTLRRLMGNLFMRRVCLWLVAWHSRLMTAKAMDSLHGTVHRRSFQDSLIVGHVWYVDH